MDWNRLALLRLVAVMFDSAGIVPGGAAVDTMPPAVRRMILRVLRPAESALRRLIFARSETEKPVGPPPAKKPPPKTPIPKGKGTGNRIPPFQLFDPRKTFPELSQKRRRTRGPGPRITSFHDNSWTPYEPPLPRGEPDPSRLCGRLQALKAALDDIPAQARRLLRLQARRRAAGEPFKRTHPLRPGFPPGHRKRRTHEIDEILKDCDWVAREGPPPPDTS